MMSLDLATPRHDAHGESAYDESHHDGVPRRARLVVAPHAGDEVLGCGGLIAKHSDTTTVLTLTQPDGRRSIQARAARRMLGDPHSIVLDLAGDDLGADLDLVVGALIEVMVQVGPVEVYLPYPWGHHDHVVAYEAGLRATSSPHVEAVAVLVYETGGGDAADRPEDIRWAVHEELTREQVERKVAAAQAYRSPWARTVLTAAAALGTGADLAWAEQFALVGSSRHIGVLR